MGKLYEFTFSNIYNILLKLIELKIENAWRKEQMLFPSLPLSFQSPCCWFLPINLVVLGRDKQPQKLY